MHFNQGIEKNDLFEIYVVKQNPHYVRGQKDYVSVGWRI